MERLTTRINDRAYCSRYFDTQRRNGKRCGHCGIYKEILERLAAYEETGMNPEEIHQMKTELAVARAVANLCRAEKPELYSDGYDKDGNLIYDEWECPRCGESYEVAYDRYDYCPNCGQKIDWSDEDE